MSYASPPHAVLPTRRSRSGSTPHAAPGGLPAHLIEGGEGHEEGEGEPPREEGREELDLMYDPMLNCYYDPKT